MKTHMRREAQGKPLGFVLSRLLSLHSLQP
ncbi:hypothetical protein CH29_gp41 [Achromobacter phage JWAlpha]|uniref:Uncharacterized protein n=1 Tax=Achromobacter phage JWAlpha TaxID=1416009 RepID=V9VEH6_9CAUD|nr:hypothetical protein CH29_gp41 [Achromobacter phage JWAlpha]AHC93994.1 hypothetical protein JJJB_0041 [Achromobacter phage JWAlpha]